MNVVMFVPFGNLNQEAGVMSMLARQTAIVLSSVTQLRCNGIFAVCDRDVESSWNRDLHACARCLGEQAALGSWAEAGILDLSGFISAEEILETRRWILGLNDDELVSARYRELNVFELCRSTFSSRFGSAEIQAGNRNHQQFARRIMLAATRMCAATRRFNNRFMPDLTLVAGGDDFISRSFIQQSRQQKKAVAVFRWEAAARAIKVFHPRSSEVFSCEFILQDITSMRSDVSTWPAELLQVTSDLMSFLSIPQGGTVLAQAAN